MCYRVSQVVVDIGYWMLSKQSEILWKGVSRSPSFDGQPRHLSPIKVEAVVGLPFSHQVLNIPRRTSQLNWELCHLNHLSGAPNCCLLSPPPPAPHPSTPSPLLQHDPAEVADPPVGWCWLSTLQCCSNSALELIAFSTTGSRCLAGRWPQRGSVGVSWRTSSACLWGVMLAFIGRARG